MTEIQAEKWTEYSFPGTKYNTEISSEMLTEEGKVIWRTRKHHDKATAVHYDRDYVKNKIAYNLFTRDPSMSLDDWLAIVTESYEYFQSNGGVLE